MGSARAGFSTRRKLTMGLLAIVTVAFVAATSAYGSARHQGVTQDVPPPTTTSMPPATTTTVAPNSGLWIDPSLAITATSLGRVQPGMTLAQAQQAAGVVFDMEGDGVHYPTTLPKGYADLFVDLGDQGQARCVGSVGGPTDRDTITTPEGFRLGDSLAHLEAVYGDRLTHVPNPITGIEPRDGYVVKDGNNLLVFSVTKDEVWGIAAGPAISDGVALTPSDCIS